MDLGVYVAQVRRPSLIVVQGDVTDAMLAGCATMASTLQGFSSGRFRATFLDGAFGDDLTSLCHDRGVDRNLGAESVGQVTFTRATDTAGSGTIPAGTQIATTPDSTGAFVIFTTDIDCVFGATDLTKTVDCSCTVIDVVGNVAAGTINRITQITLLWDTTLTVINSVLFAGGAPSESDDDLRNRTRNYWVTQARGTIDALEYAARLVPGVVRVSVVVDESGVVTVYVADAEGNSNQAMADAVDAVIEGPPAWRDAADVVDVVGASLFETTIVLSLGVKTGVDVNTLLDGVRSAVVAMTSTLNPGDTLYRDAISTAAKNYAPDQIVTVQVLTPAVDLVPGADQAIYVQPSDVTFS